MKKFKNIDKAIEFLNDVYGDDWYSINIIETIYINSVRTFLDNGLLMDPLNNEDGKYVNKLMNNKNYSKYNIRKNYE